jgi:hypothetical protein
MNNSKNTKSKHEKMQERRKIYYDMKKFYPDRNFRWNSSAREYNEAKLQLEERENNRNRAIEIKKKIHKIKLKTQIVDEIANRKLLSEFNNFLKDDNKFIFDIQNPNEILALIDRLKIKNNDLILKIDHWYVNFSEAFKSKIIDIMRNVSVQEYKNGSDVEFIENLDVAEVIQIIKKNKQRKRINYEESRYKRRGGNFFKYYLKCDFLDLSQYGIHKTFDPKNYKVNCLIRALINSGKLKKKDIRKIRLMTMREEYKVNINRHIPMTKVKLIAEELKIRIVVKTLRKFSGKHSKTTTIRTTYGQKHREDKTIQIGLIDEHYFIIDRNTGITGNALENHEKYIREKQRDWKTITKYKRVKGKQKGYAWRHKSNDKSKCITSFNLIKYLIEHADKFLEEITLDKKTIGSLYEDKISNHGTLSIDEDEYKNIYSRSSKLRQILNKHEKYDNLPSLSEDPSTENYINKLEKAKKSLEKYKKKIDEKSEKILSKSTNIKKSDCKESENKEQEDVKKHKSSVQRQIDLIDNEIEITTMPKIFFDVETYPDGANKHKPYVVCCIDGDETRTYRGKYCALNFLKSIKQNSLLIAHNCLYDFSFLLKYLSREKVMVKDSFLITAKATFHNMDTNKFVKLIFKDSYKLIPMRLAEFGKAFGLEQSKEVISHDVYNKKTINKPSIRIYKTLKELNSQTDKDQFKYNIKQWKLEKPEYKYDHIQYSINYCVQDCKVLKQGYTTFQKSMLKITGYNIDSIISISSVAHNFLISEDIYKGCKQISGTARHFIQNNMLIGGKVMTRNNKRHVVNDKLQDLDAVSLYPSAMKRLADKYGGFLKGAPILLKPLPVEIQTPSYKPDSPKVYFNETCNLAKLMCIIENPDHFKSQLKREYKKEDHDPFTIARNVFNKFLMSNGRKIMTEFKKTYEDNIGRLFAKGSQSGQNLMREIRHSICDEIYYDIDAVNCHPVILLHLCKKYDLPRENLEKLIIDREAIFAELLKINPDRDRDHVKKTILSMINGGEKDYRELNKNKWIKDLKKDLEGISERICKEFPDLYNFRKNICEDRGKHNPEFSTLNCILCENENKIIQAAYEYYNSINAATTETVLCFDGIMLPKNDLIPKHLKDCEKYVQTKTSIPIKLKIKPMTEGFDFSKMDLEKYEQKVNHLLSQPFLSYDRIKRLDGYFVRIKILEVNNPLPFPLMSYKNPNNNNVRTFSNDMIGKTIGVDKIQLEDLIKFHKIKFEIIDGYYFNQGRNKKIGDMISTLFKERAEMKKQKNKIQTVYKLLMNSAYGKTILKENKCDIIVKDSIKDAENYINRNFNYIKHYMKTDTNKYIIYKYKTFNKHFNMVHIGCEILSMSKRIMNEVMCLAEDEKIKIYYQDTDSMHIEADKIPQLEKAFKIKYKRTLTGNQMGQFHCDFDSEIKPLRKEIFYKGHTKVIKVDKNTNPVSIRSIFLGKKSYLDRLQYTHNNKNYFGYHIRMKSIPIKSLLQKCCEEKITPYELYLNLHKGVKYEFNLLYKQVRFEQKKNFIYYKRSRFMRTVYFKDGKQYENDKYILEKVQVQEEDKINENNMKDMKSTVNVEELYRMIDQEIEKKNKKAQLIPVTNSESKLDIKPEMTNAVEEDEIIYNAECPYDDFKNDIENDEMQSADDMRSAAYEDDSYNECTLPSDIEFDPPPDDTECKNDDTECKSDDD